MENIQDKTNEELLELFEDANFNQGFNSAKNQEHLSLSPKEICLLKEEILKRMEKPNL